MFCDLDKIMYQSCKVFYLFHLFIKEISLKEKRKKVDQMMLDNFNFENITLIETKTRLKKLLL